MKQGLFTIVENTRLTESVWQMRLVGDTSAITAPGQFVNILLAGKFLRRPISVCDCEGDELTLVYKVVGGGTEQMSRMERGETLDILTGLGNGYDLTESGEAPLLLGGGVGVPPLYMLAKKLTKDGKKVSVIRHKGYSRLCYKCNGEHRIYAHLHLRSRADAEGGLARKHHIGSAQL